MFSEFVKTPAVGEWISPADAMTLAIQEGAKGTGYVSPNPLVGCVIVDSDHCFLASGYHKRVGHDHAEIDALKNLGDPSRVAGAHVYVTLEPCAHQGRTGSCARALAPLKPASVIYAVEDPNPLVAGKGAQILREAGVRCELLSAIARPATAGSGAPEISSEDCTELAAQAEELAEIFLHNFRAKEPFVAVKVASSLDGKMAFLSGESKWITGPDSREHVQLLRARYDAIAVGRNTFVADNPSLNVRHASFPGFVNKAVVFDPSGKTLVAMQGSNLTSVRPPENVLVLVDAKLSVQNPAGVRVLKVPMMEEGAFMMDELFAALRAEGVHSLMIEGGSHAYGAFFNAKKVQRLHAFIAPILMGGKHGLAWTSHFGGASMQERVELKRVQKQSFGADEYWTARV